MVVRRELDEWEKFSIEQKEKIKILKMDNLDELKESHNFAQFKGIDSVFCCLGTRTKYGKELFLKVDYHYPLYSADIALANNIPHYSLVSSISADANSFFFYLKTKGQVEKDLILKQFPFLSIYRPGAILNRENDARMLEKVAACVPFLKKVEVRDIAIAMRKEAEEIAEKRKIYFSSTSPITAIIENNDIVRNATA